MSFYISFMKMSPIVVNIVEAGAEIRIEEIK